MILDKDEEYISELQPDKKILISWFFTKNIVIGVFVVFMIFTYIALSTALEMPTEGGSQATKLVEDYVSNKITKQQSRKDRLNLMFLPALSSLYIILSLALLAVLIMQIYLSYLRKSFKYIITNKRCVFIGGIFKRVERVVPYTKITDIQRSQNILERILGIWNIQIFTPGTGSITMGQRSPRAELNFDGLLNSEIIVEQINKQVRECA